MPAITIAGENLIALKQSLSQNLVIDKMVFANVPELDDSASVDRNEGMPATDHISAIMDVTQASAVNGNTVVYSSVLASSVGTWSFNWMGLYSSADDTIVAVAYVPTQEKRATVGEVLGNVFTKNFAIEFNAASTTTGVLIDAQSWQIDYTARLDAIGELDRSLMEKAIGPSLFAGDAFLPKYENSQWKISAGHAIARGLYMSLDQDLVFVPGALPKTVWIDLYQEKTLANIETKIDIVIGEGRVDYIDDGIQHYLIPLATLTSTTNITDLRCYTGDTLEVFHQGNLKPATTERAGYTQLSNNTKGNSETKAATEKAVNLAMPTGGIIMWSGSIASIPDGWALCDGTQGTPNLTERFIIGAGSDLSPGTTGGSLEKTTESAGAHSHSITVNSHTLSSSQMPSHSHQIVAGNQYNDNSTSKVTARSASSATNANRNTGTAGSSSSHNHGASSSSAGAHTHAIADIRPPYYALAFIMKI